MNSFRFFRKKLRDDRRGHKGFSIAETLVALLIVSLLSMGIATGVAFATKQYRQSVIRSESKVLCSTLSSIIRDELLNANFVYSGSPMGIDSQNYNAADSSGKRCIMMQTGEDTYSYGDSAYGLICMADQGTKAKPLELIPAAAYSAYGLKANAKAQYDATGGYFNVEIHVRNSKGDDQAEARFIVVPLNELQIK